MAVINSVTCPDLESELRLGRSKIIVHGGRLAICKPNPSKPVVLRHA